MHRMSVLVPLATVILAGSSTADAQLLPDPSNVLQPTPAIVNGVLTVGGVTLQPDDASTQEELPGLGHKFELFGSMIHDTDPEFPAGNPGHSGGGAGRNETISADTTGGALAFAYRKLGSGIRIQALTNQIGLKYYFTATRSCAAGTPRIVLLIDSDGDGDSDFAANGHVNPPTHAGCAPMRWATEDLTDEGPRWEVTPGGFVPGLSAFPYNPWDLLVQQVTATFPNHKVLAGFLLDGESCTFPANTCGKAYYDLVTLENRTLEIWQDAVRQ